MTARFWSAGAVALAILVPLEQIADPSALQLDWLRANAIEVETVEAGNGFADLRKLKAALGDARIVALGEATHGTREIFQMKHRLVEYLAAELGFTIFSIEANMPEAYRVNDYVLHGKGDAKALLKGMYFWTWNTEEVLAMIEWMRQFNASGKGRIQFTGFDMQTTSVAVGIVQDLLRKADADYESRFVRTVYLDVANLRSGQAGFGVATGTFPVKAAAGRTIRFSGSIKTQDVSGGYGGLWWRADGPSGVLAFDNMAGRGPSGTTDWQRYEITLAVPPETTNINFGMIMPGQGTAWFDDLRLEIDGASYDATESFDFDFESGQIKGFFSPPAASGYAVRIDSANASHGTRSLQMESAPASAVAAKPADAAGASRRCGEIVAHMEKMRGDYLKQADPTAVDWAIQNARVVHQYAQMVANVASRDESMARNVKWILDTAPDGARVVLWAHNGHVGRMSQGRFRAMGSYLDEWYGKDHVVVGFASNRGEYTAVGRGTGLGRHPLKAAAAGSYEYVFARAGISRFILDLRTARASDAASGWLSTPMQFRSIGAMAMDQQFHTADLPKLFDLMVFLDETTATHGLWSVQKN
jgi:erythromycin esterase-like protein